LRTSDRVDVEIVPALSFLDLIWARLGVDPLVVMPRIVNGQQFARDAAGQTGALVVAQCDSQSVLSAIKLAYEDATPSEVIVLQRLGLPDENIETIKWEELDRAVQPDHLTTLFIPQVDVAVARDLERLHELARELREACPWDREQTHESLARYAIEETYELVDAIQLNNPDDEHLIEELGDVLFQVFAHSAIAEEQGRFNISDVARNVTEKLIERHPHVYGDVIAETAEDVKATWEANKMVSKGRSSVMDGIPRNLPALMLATKALKKAANTQVGLNVEDVEVTGLGAALLVMVDEARKRGEDPEDALRNAADVFMDAFKAQESEQAAGRAD
jgi:tetrapyrrole methylase family protein / MazG family protein